MIPQVAELGFVSFCDVYCDEGYFTVDDARRILEAGAGGRDGGEDPRRRVLGDRRRPSWPPSWALTSADHLNHTDRPTMRRLAERGVIGVVMPGTRFRRRPPASVRRACHARVGDDDRAGDRPLPGLLGGVPAAGDGARCAGSTASRQHVALRATTVDAARALGLDDRGSLEAGRLADLQIWDVSAYEDADLQDRAQRGDHRDQARPRLLRP